MTEAEIAQLRHQLAAIEHTRWSDWQRYVHSKGERQADGSLTLPAYLVEGWERQLATPYEALTERERQSDMEQVDRYWPLIEPIIAASGPPPMTNAERALDYLDSAWIYIDYAKCEPSIAHHLSRIRNEVEAAIDELSDASDEWPTVVNQIVS